MMGTIETSAWAWNPVVWLIAMAAMMVIAYVLRSTGNKKYKKGTEQSMPFFSGNKVGGTHVKAGNIYWGFFEALERYYVWLRRMHTGIVGDYVYGFVLVVAVMMVVIVLGGFI